MTPMPPTRLVMVPAITIPIRSPVANVILATVAINVPLATVLAAPDRATVPVNRAVPLPGAVVPVSFSTVHVPDEEAVVKTEDASFKRMGRVQIKTQRVASVAVNATATFVMAALPLI